MTQNKTSHPRIIAIVGGGPAGLMAAEIISQGGHAVHVYDAMPSVGRKFLMAGKGGLNITHSEDFDYFKSRFSPADPTFMAGLNAFRPEDLINWVHGLGIKTFIGSSGRVFPEEMKAAPLLRAWLHRLRQAGVQFHMRHRWLGWKENDPRRLIFQTPAGEITVQAAATVLAMGGASWPQLGSTGEWTHVLAAQGIQNKPLRPANCGFDIGWSEHFRNRFAGEPLKSITATFGNRSQKGDCIVTKHGIEGGLIYSLSADLRNFLAAHGTATLLLDLKPNQTIESLLNQAAKPRNGQSFANHLRKRLHLEPVQQALLREVLSSDEIQDAEKLCRTIKALPLTLRTPRPIAEAISSAGGIDFAMLDENLMLKPLPCTFCAGEMLDWEAPTGGYLLTGCLASGRQAGLGVLKWLEKSQT